MKRDEGYSPDKDEFDQLDDHYWRITSPMKWLAAIVLIGWAASYPARYIADCTDYFGAVDCAKAWAGWED